MNNYLLVIFMKRLINFIPYFIMVAVFVFCVLFFGIIPEKSVNNEIDRLVVVDAGHGGKDGGASAADGTQEQFINLDIALKLSDILTKNGYKVVMTRTDNNSIHDESADTIREQKVSDIHNRLKIIEANPDCIFVSIHQNHYTQSKYSGTQVFYSDNNPDSSILAQYIQSAVVSAIQPENKRQIKASGDSIYLLYHAKVPAVMVECGFLSNVQETEKLKDDNYRQQLAQAIADGINQYFSRQQETESFSG